MQAKRNKRYAPWGLAVKPLTLRLKQEEIDQIDKIAVAIGCSRSSCIRMTVIAGLPLVSSSTQVVDLSAGEQSSADLSLVAKAA